MMWMLCIVLLSRILMMVIGMLRKSGVVATLTLLGRKGPQEEYKEGWQDSRILMGYGMWLHAPTTLIFSQNLREVGACMS